MPQILGPDDSPPDAAFISDYAAAAEALGFKFVTANDHIVHRFPWVDGPLSLAIAAGATKRVRLSTSIIIPAVRNPFVTAKTLAALDHLSKGRLTVGVGAGSYEPDYTLAGVPFAERWRRLDQSVITMRAAWRGEDIPNAAGPYAMPSIDMRPEPLQPGGPPIWIGAWGSPAGIRRVARLADGWFASAYNTTPEKFAADWKSIGEMLPRYHKDPQTFPNALATMFTYVSNDRSEIAHIVGQKLGPAIGRAADDLSSRLLIGTADECVRLVRAYANAGLQRIFIWPAGNEIDQLRIFAEQVIPHCV